MGLGFQKVVRLAGTCPKTNTHSTSPREKTCFVPWFCSKVKRTASLYALPARQEVTFVAPRGRRPGGSGAVKIQKLAGEGKCLKDVDGGDRTHDLLPSTRPIQNLIMYQLFVPG